MAFVPSDRLAEEGSVTSTDTVPATGLGMVNLISVMGSPKALHPCGM